MDIAELLIVFGSLVPLYENFMYRDGDRKKKTRDVIKNYIRTRDRYYVTRVPMSVRINRHHTSPPIARRPRARRRAARERGANRRAGARTRERHPIDRLERSSRANPRARAAGTVEIALEDV